MNATATATPDLLADACTDPSCVNAESRVELCECRCKGDGHGAAHRARREAFAAQQAARLARHGGDVFAMLGLDQADDDMIPSARRPGWESRVDPDDMF
jgi:hypothetical protein